MKIQKIKTSTSGEHEKKTKNKYVNLKKYISIFCVTVLLFCCGYGIYHIATSSRYRISRIAIEGSSIGDADFLEDVVKKNLEGSILFIPKNHSITFPKKRVRNFLEKNFPLYSIVQVEGDYMKEEDDPIRQLKITVKERQYAYIWCESITENLSVDACFYADNDGFIFYPAPSFSGSPYVRFTTVTKKRIGQSILDDKKVFQNLISYIDFIRSQGIPVESVSIYEDQILFYFEGAQKTRSEIRLLPSNTFDEYRVNLKAFFEKRDIKERVSNNVHDFIYIDARYKDRIFYKLYSKQINTRDEE